MRINALLIFDILIQLIFGFFFFFFFSEYSDTFALIFSIIYLLCPFLLIGGIALLNSKYYQIGMYIVFFTNIFFLPIGIVGFIGARKITDKIEQSKFE